MWDANTARFLPRRGGCRVDKMLLTGVFHLDFGQQQRRSAVPLSPFLTAGWGGDGTPGRGEWEIGGPLSGIICR